MSGSERRPVGPWVCALISAFWVGALYLQRRDVGFTAQDDGYLWYGVQAVLRGEVPLRDFNSYDPGRFYWCALFGWLLDDGFGTLRLATSAAAAVGVFFGLRAAVRCLDGAAGPVVLGAVLALWSQPWWKSFEPALSLVGVWAGVRFLERPTGRAHLLLGVCVGVLACFGRNHGVYVGLAAGGLVTLVALRSGARSWPRGAGLLALGTLVGYSPVLLAAALAPGFGASFVESLGYFAQQGHLSGKRAIPWPWSFDFAAADGWTRSHRLGIGLGYLAIPLVYLPGLALALRTRADDLPRRALLIAATFVGAGYVHHALVHAAYNHLAQAIHPLFLALCAWPVALGAGRVARAGTLAGLLVLALATNVPALESVHRARLVGLPDAYRQVPLGRETLWQRGDLADYHRLLMQAVETNVPAREAVFLAPSFPGLYCALGRVAPTWDIYMAWQGTPQSQARLVRQLAAVNWILISDVGAGGQEWMRFANTNPQAWELIQREFEIVPVRQRMPRDHYLLRRSSPPR